MSFPVVFRGRPNRTARKVAKLRDKRAAVLWPVVGAVGCGGICCAAFILVGGESESFEESLAIAKRHIKDGTAISIDHDTALWGDLVVPLTSAEAQRRLGAQLKAHPDATWYTCKWWDDRSGLCKHRDLRPIACRRYECASCLQCKEMTARAAEGVA